MNIGMSGKFVVHKQKVKMLNGVPELDNNGEQILIGEPCKVSEFDNLITNAGLDTLGGISTGTLRFFLSTDNTEPNVDDTSVAGIIGGSNTRQGSGLASENLSDAPYYISNYRTVRFAAGIATGNIAKLAVGYSSNDTSINNLWSVALVKDSSGVNSVITKLPDEVLDVTYELKKYFMMDDYTGVVSISDVNYNVVVRTSYADNDWFGSSLMPIFTLQNVWASNRDITNIKSSPASPVSDGVITQKPYKAQDYFYEFDISFGLNEGNVVGGIRSVYVDWNNPRPNRNNWQIRFGKVSDDSTIPKTNEYTLKLPPFRIEWGRYEPT